ncbi:hypothetical protein SUGI_0785630 [Cryptomeria japonica]|nr:hypothetical protein SUGI_0785630 [Cryptomeria japonica]
MQIDAINELDRTKLIDAWKVWMDDYIMGVGKVPFGNEAWNNTWRKKETPVKADLRLKHDRFANFTLPLEQAIDKLIKENDILAFIKGSRTMPLCVLSSRVLVILYEQMVNYETIDVLDEVHNLGLGKALKAYTSCSIFPQIFVNGKFIGGVNDLDEMAEKGELYKLFKMQRMLY